MIDFGRLKFRTFWNCIPSKFIYWNIDEDGIHAPIGPHFTFTDVMINSDYFAGEQDKNGVDIYVGDIIIARYFDEWLMAKIIDEGRKGFYPLNTEYEGDRWHAVDFDSMEIVGNIYQHNELIGNKRQFSNEENMREYIEICKTK